MVGGSLSTAGRRGVDYIGVGVGAVILNDRDEVLLLLRKDPPEIDHWTIPGGAVEWFEACRDAVVRECLEEVGLVVQVERQLAVVDHISREDSTHWVSVEYLCTIVSGDVANWNKAENIDLRWFSLDALPPRLTQPTREALAAYRSPT